MIILGIDPGLATIGYGVIEVVQDKAKLLAFGTIQTSKNKDHLNRLEQIHQELDKIIKKYKPDKIATEELFFCKNVKTALKVGQAIGVIFLTVCQKNRTIKIYTPLQVKQAVSGYGRASKQQVQRMVKSLLKLDEIPRPDDAADALAIAITCAHDRRT